jgi:hypothetical protein
MSGNCVSTKNELKATTWFTSILALGGVSTKNELKAGELVERSVHVGRVVSTKNELKDIEYDTRCIGICDKYQQRMN